MTRILQIGKSGQLGLALLQAAPSAGVALQAAGREALDLSQPESVATFMASAEPFDAVIIAAAYTAVDRAETEAAVAEAVNHLSVAEIGKAAAARGAPVVHVSTDYVFDGLGGAPYAEDAPLNPLNVYGASKARGETALLAANPGSVILRTSWVYAPGSANFVTTMRRLGRERAELRVVDDQRGCPTHADDLALACIEAVLGRTTDRVPPGVYHYSGSGDCSWAEYAQLIMDLDSAERPMARVTPIESREYPTPARRPLDTRLNCARFDVHIGTERPDWRTRLTQAIANWPMAA